VTLAFARDLRRNPTDAEKVLWRELRAKRFIKYKFRRQQPLGPFIVDFVCLQRRLIIEADGGHHARTVEEDLARTRWLESQGFRLMRFWNNQILFELASVLEVIASALDGFEVSPSP
jgi:very-short-patch-repair endonuclease